MKYRVDAYYHYFSVIVFYVEANSHEEALKEAKNRVDSGEFNAKALDDITLDETDIDVNDNSEEELLHIKRMASAAESITNILRTTSNMTCEYVRMSSDIRQKYSREQVCCDNHGYDLRDNDEYMVITCENGYRYFILVSMDSPVTACEETLRFMQDHM